MLRPYVDLLKRPGALAFSGAGLYARLPISMESLGIVLLVSATTGSYALAGGLSAAFALAAAGLSPVGSRFADRWGQARTLPVLAAVAGSAMLALAAAVVAGAATGVLFALAIVSGAFQPNIGSLVRARWAAMLSGTPSVRVAFALESVIDELIFVIGPPLAALLAAAVAPAAALVVAAVILLTGSALLAVQRSTQPRPARHDDLPPARSAVREPGVVLMAVAFVLVGGVFGSTEVTAVAFAAANGGGLLAGVLLALAAFGSLVGGLVYGVRQVRLPLPSQLVIGTSIVAVGSAPMPFLSSPWLLGAALLLSGLAVAPTLIIGFTYVESVVDARQLTEAITWSTTGITLGVALSASVAGAAIDAAGPSAGFAVTLAAAVGAALLAAAVRPALLRLGRAEPTPGAGPEAALRRD